MISISNEKLKRLKVIIYEQAILFARKRSRDHEKYLKLEDEFIDTIIEIAKDVKNEL